MFNVLFGNNIKNKKNLCYIIFLFVFFVVSLLSNIYLSNTYWIKAEDDKWFAENVPYLGYIWHFLSIRYQHWSSRIFIEYILINILNSSPYIWAFLNSLIMTLIFYSIGNISNIKHMLSYLILSVAIMTYFILPDVGLCSVSINYIWPLACGLFFISVIKDIYFDEKQISLLKKIICCVLLFFSCNAELMCVFLLIFIFFLFFYASINNEKINKFIFISLLIILIGFLIHLLCPGNYERIFEEGSDYSKSFYKFSNIGLIQIFLYVFINSFLGIKHPFFIETFIVLLFFCGIKNKKAVVISSIPLITLLIGKFIIKFFPNFRVSLFITSFNSSSNIISLFSSSNLNILYVIIITLIIFFFMLCCGEYVLYKYFNKKSFYYINLIFFSSFVIRLFFSWSPSMFTSQERTFVFTNYFILCLNMIIINSLLKDLKINNKLMKFITFKIKE